MNNQEERLKAGKRVVTITLTPAVDMFVQVEKLMPGTLHRIPKPEKFVGGKGINVAKALQAFGTPVVATGFLGGANGRWIESQLQHLGIDARFVSTATETRLNVKVVDSEGVLTEFNSSTTLPSPGEWTEIETRLAALAGESEWFAFCGKLPEGCPAHWYQEAIAKAKELGLKTLLDSSGAALRHGILAKPDVIKPNLHELEELTGLELSSVEKVVSVAQEIVADGVGMVLVSMGASGMVVVTQDATWEVRVPKVEVVSSVGAGDTVVAGILHGLCTGKSMKETIRFAAAAATAAVTTAGTKRPELADVLHFEAAIQVVERRANR
jgi:1-phosphofructokinase family hexose kinase